MPVTDVSHKGLAAPGGGTGHRADPYGQPYLPHVDGLRGLAVLLVVCFHAWPSLVPGGYAGVDVFFVISGFVITRQISIEIRAGHFSYLQFLGRRIRRLAPAAFVCFGVAAAVGSLLLYPSALVELAQSVVASIGMAANFFFLDRSGYFEAPAGEKPLLHAWSLAVEDQFYLVWPLALLLIARSAGLGRKALAVIAALGLASLVHSAVAVERHPDYAFYMFPPRAWELLIGCGLALATERVRPMSRLLLETGGFAGIAAIFASTLLLTSESPFPGLAAVPVCLGTALAIVAGLGQPTLVFRVLSLPPAVLAGKISYSIYLWHWPILVYTRFVLDREPTALEAALAVGASVLAAYVSWRWIEQPFRGPQPVLGLASAKRTFGSAAAYLAAMAVFAYAITAGAGWPWRFEGPVRELLAQISSASPRRPICDGYQNVLVKDEACQFGRPRKPGEPFDMAVIGDSNADHFVPMLAILAERAGLSGRQVTHPACGPAIGAMGERDPRKEAQCLKFQEAIGAFLERHRELKLVVLSSVWTKYQEDTTPNRLAPDALREGKHDYARFLEATVSGLRQRGVKVLLLDTIPHFKPEQFRLSCFVRKVRGEKSASDCGFPVDQANALIEPWDRVFQRLAAADAGISVHDFRPQLCEGGVCSGFRDGVFVYRDKSHLSAVGSELLARFVRLPSLP